ncbi:hypothetical protein KP509_02G089200 [Ceratopteris richardii]|nr:hypothetical protein KP509_02G089200 [Ceratopteris richardii]
MERIEENQVKMAEVLGNWEKQMRSVESENKELKGENNNLKRKIQTLQCESGVRRGKQMRKEVLDIRTGRVMIDCYHVMIEEEPSRDRDDLMRRVERMEHEIEKVQSIICRYSDQAGKACEEFHLELERMKSAQAKSDEKVRHVEKENAKLSSKLGRWMNRKDDETRGQVEDSKVGKMEEELKALLDRLDTFGTELERTKDELSKKVDDLDEENMSKIWEERSIREEVEKLTVPVEKREDIPLGSEKRVREDKGMEQIWNRFRSIDSDLFQYQSDIEHNKQGLRDLAVRLEALRGTMTNGSFQGHLSGQVESLRGRGWR